MRFLWEIKKQAANCNLVRHLFLVGVLAWVGCAHKPLPPEGPVEKEPSEWEGTSTSIRDDMIRPEYVKRFVQQVCGLPLDSTDKKEGAKCDAKFSETFIARLNYEFPLADWAKFETWSKANPFLFQGVSWQERWANLEKYAAITHVNRRNAEALNNSSLTKQQQIQRGAAESPNSANILSNWANVFGGIGIQNQINNLQQQQNQLQWQQQTGGKGIRPY